MGLGAGQLFAVAWDQAGHYQATVTQVVSHVGAHIASWSSHTSTLVAPGGAEVEISNSFDADFGTWLPLMAEANGRAQAQQAWDAVQEWRKTTYGPCHRHHRQAQGTLPWPLTSPHLTARLQARFERFERLPEPVFEMRDLSPLRSESDLQRRQLCLPGAPGFTEGAQK
ncbi:hypothetical protein ABZ876_34850 [Streptomyces sp. NPDC046931]|uniref:hypothetical protein n=1 Tax=Streptomyces sp. NPDC046931 TaxID=3154806 RepID=UPI0033F89E6A